MAQEAFPPIEDLIPHRSPMILLDRMVACGNMMAACEVDIQPGIQFSNDNDVPPYVGIEYMAQAIAAFSGFQRRSEGLPVEIGFLIGAAKFTSFCSSFRFGQTLLVEVVHTWGGDQLAQFECGIKDARTEELLQKASLSVFHPEDGAEFLKGLKQ